MFASKRFIAFIIGALLFVVTTYTTKYPPMELAGAISIICGVYTTAETIRKSDNPELK
jgi:hypothetical protein